MARLPLIGQSVRRKRIGIALTIWLQICRIANYVKRLINARDETCIEQVRMNRTAFFKLCEMLQMLGGLKSSRNMLVDEQAKPITANSSNPRWKWFKNCLGALDGTHIRIRVSTIDKPRYRTRKGDIAINMLGVCTPDMQFVYVLPGWEGFVADGRVLRDAISRRHGLKVPHAELGEGLPSNVIDDDEPNTVNIHPSDAWATWRMELANQMFEEWQASGN
ncbi:hypothetical protein Gotur_022410 [Gossypium turneri]